VLRIVDNTVYVTEIRCMQNARRKERASHEDEASSQNGASNASEARNGIT
jgi:hypothetical protein